VGPVNGVAGETRQVPENLRAHSGEKSPDKKAKMRYQGRTNGEKKETPGRGTKKKKKSAGYGKGCPGHRAIGGLNLPGEGRSKK